jgi:hypothetical protein
MSNVYEFGFLSELAAIHFPTGTTGPPPSQSVYDIVFNGFDDGSGAVPVGGTINWFLFASRTGAPTYKTLAISGVGAMLTDNNHSASNFTCSLPNVDASANIYLAAQWKTAIGGLAPIFNNNAINFSALGVKTNVTVTWRQTSVPAKVLGTIIGGPVSFRTPSLLLPTNLNHDFIPSGNFGTPNTIFYPITFDFTGKQAGLGLGKYAPGGPT